MNKTFFIALLILNSLLYSQKIDNIGKISLSVINPEVDENININQITKMESKILEILSENGLTGIGYNNNFVVYPKFTIYDTNVVEGGMKNILVVTCQLTLFIKQVNNNLIFSTISKTLKGSGNNVANATTNAISQINPKEKDYKTFVETGKQKILNYYQDKCSEIIKNSDVLLEKNEYDAALANIFTIPQEATECYEKAQSKSIEYYKRYQSAICEQKIQIAKGFIAKNEYSNAINLLTEIDPSAKCNQEAKILINKIENKISQLEKQELDMQMKIYNDSIALEKQRIEAAKSIAISYYNNSIPQTINYSYIIK